MGVSRRELEYWTRLRLLLPRARWGERFYNFSDLVALETDQAAGGAESSRQPHPPGRDNAQKPN